MVQPVTHALFSAEAGPAWEARLSVCSRSSVETRRPANRGARYAQVWPTASFGTRFIELLPGPLTARRGHGPENAHLEVVGFSHKLACPCVHDPEILRVARCIAR